MASAQNNANPPPCGAEAEEHADRGEPSWSLLEAALLGVGFFAVMALVGFVGRALHLENWVGPALAPFVLLPLADAALCIAIWRILLVHGGRPEQLGLKKDRLPRYLLLACVAFVVSLPAFWVALSANERLLDLLGVARHEHPLLLALRKRPPAAAVALLVGYAALVRPVVEELYFRGFLLPPLQRHLGTALAIIVNALVFGLPHYQQPQGILPLVLLGALLAALYAYSRSLAATIVVHVLNSALTLFVLLVSAASPQAPGVGLY